MSSLHGDAPSAYVGVVKAATNPDGKLSEGDGAVEAGYAAWKRAKIERGLDQARDRATMIPIERLIDDLGLER